MSTDHRRNKTFVEFPVMEDEVDMTVILDVTAQRVLQQLLDQIDNRDCDGFLVSLQKAILIEQDKKQKKSTAENV